MNIKLILLFVLTFAPFTYISANDLQNAQITYGAIKKHLVKNQTTQVEVLKIFGSPNNMTINSNSEEVWVYDSISTISSISTESGNEGISIGIGASSGDVIGGLFTANKKNKSELNSNTSTKSLTIILEFDKNSILKDYSARVGRY